jgi:transcription termination factor Rho
VSETDLVTPGVAPEEGVPGTSGGSAATPTRRKTISTMVLAELRQLAGELNIADTAKMRKGDLIAAIKERQAGGSAPQLPLPVTSGNGDAPVETNGAAPADEAEAVAPTRRRRAASRPAGAPRRVAEPAAEPAVEPAADAAPAAVETVAAPVETPPVEAPPAVELPVEQPVTEQPPAEQPTVDRTDVPAPGGTPAESDGDPTPRRSRQRRSRGDRTDRAEQGENGASVASPTIDAPTTESVVEGGDGGGRGRENGRARGDRGPRTDDRGPRTDDRGPRTDRMDDRGPRTDDRGPRTDRTDDRGPRTDRTDDRRDIRGDDRNTTRNTRSNTRDDARDNLRDNGPRDDDEGDDDGDGRGRRGRRFRDRRRGRDRDRGPQPTGGGGTIDTEVREDDVLLPVAGIVDILDNYAFVRTTGYLAGPTDVYVSLSMVRRYGLRRGDAVTGAVRQPREGEQSRQKFNPLVRVDTLNGQDPDAVKNRPEFTKLTPLYPNERLRLETEPHKLTTRVIDLVMPVGKGQRALIVSPPKAGKTTIMQNIANAITTNNPECHLMVVLVDERPEEVTDMQRSVKGEVIASTFDRPPTDHTTVAELSIERAKRLVEMGHDVVVLLDNITRLGRAYNLAAPASGRILSGGVDSTALYPPKRFLGAARNIEGGGSLTIFATALVETGSTMDTVIFEEFKGTGNAELKLDRKIADKRIFPAIDVGDSGTRKEELLMSPDEYAVMVKLRRVLGGLGDEQAINLLLDQLRKTRTNIEFLMQVAKTTPGNDD